MRIVFVSTEVVPFAKTGGLADVCGALPRALAGLGHEVSVIMPAFRQTKSAGRELVPTDVTVDVPIGAKIVSGRILRSTLPGDQVPVYLVDQPEYYDRPELYRDTAAGEDYRDNCERFVFFCRAALEATRQLNLRPDVLHVHDWQTALVPAYLNLEYRRTPGFEHTASLITIHNMAFQGIFWHWDMLLTGLDWRYFNYHQMEFYGKLNLLKTGLVFADAITTVSPKYALEIQSPPLGCGLEGVLSQRKEVLSGILNGVDYGIWDPAHDPHLAARYDAASVLTGKAACKAALQAELGLPQAAETPLIGFVGRLSNQKGLDLIVPVVRRWAETTDAQWVFLGFGDVEWQTGLERIAKQYPHKVAVRFELSETLAHRIEAGADMFLMPSLYEPCGLTQLYSLKYGAVPVVRATGGLFDSICDTTAETLATGRANGFTFVEYTEGAMEEALLHAVNVYRSQPEVWRQIVQTGMAQDWSWDASAAKYSDLYQRTAAARR